MPLIGPQGIFKPAVFPELPLTIATAPVREGEAPPYSDGLDDNDLLNYRYRGTDPNHRDNVGLREAMRQKVPLRYGLQEIAGQRILLPSNHHLWPQAEFLEERYEMFRKAS